MSDLHICNSDYEPQRFTLAELEAVIAVRKMMHNDWEIIEYIDELLDNDMIDIHLPYLHCKKP